MGYWGHLVVARSRLALSALRELKQFGTPGQEEHLGGEWRLARAAGRTPSLRSAAGAVKEATRGPVLVAFVLDSDCAVVEAQTHIGLRWTGILNPEVAAGSYAVPMDQYDSPARAVLGALEWSRQARLSASETHLRKAFTEKAALAEDLFDSLLIGLGIKALSASN